MHDLQSDIDAVQRLAAIPRILATCVRSTGLRCAAVARVTDSRWVACAVRDELGFGLAPGGELALHATLCAEVRRRRQPIAFARAGADPHRPSDAAPRLHGIERALSVPIIRGDGDFFGTLCAVDTAPAARADDPEVLDQVQLFADLIAQQLDADALAHRRERFIAILGHDLRSPLGAIATGADTLGLLALSAPAQRIVASIQRSAARMDGLVHDLLDFARGRLGEGIPVRPVAEAPIAALLGQVIAEVQAAHPRARILPVLDLAAPVPADPARLAQLFANLLGNAVEHGEPDAPIRIDAVADGEGLRVAVHNRGAPLPAADRARLFEPFQRGTGTAGGARRDGLGLGLYIAAEIARAHGGTLALDDTVPTGTRVVLTLPAASPGAPAAAPGTA